MNSPRILGHRGASSVRKENTLEAFLHVAELGGDGFELDVRRTADGALALHHDANLEDGRLIVELAAAELPDYVPQLRDVLVACAGMYVNIEIKNVPIDADWDPDESVAAAVADLVAELDIAERVIVSCFGMGAIDAVRARNPAIPTAWLTITQFDQLEAVALAVEHGHTAIHPHFTVVTKDLVDAATAAGIVVNTWTVDHPDEMKRVADLGVACIVTNDVALAVATLRG